MSPDPSSKDLAPFLKKLRRMLNEVPTNVLCWTRDGRAFEIHDMEAMTRDVLPVYFKHNKYSSFQRQLNYFNFRKWTKSKAVVCTFSNDYFTRDRPDLDIHINRKKSQSAIVSKGSRRQSISQQTPRFRQPVSSMPFTGLHTRMNAGFMPGRTIPSGYAPWKMNEMSNSGNMYMEQASFGTFTPPNVQEPEGMMKALEMPVPHAMPENDQAIWMMDGFFAGSTNHDLPKTEDDFSGPSITKTYLPFPRSTAYSSPRKEFDVSY